MYKGLRDRLLKWFKVPLEPQPPFGDPHSIRVFRASRKLFYLRLIRWSFGQVLALIGLLFWLGVVAVSEHEAAKARSQPPGTMFRNLPSGRNQFTTAPLRVVPQVVFQGLWVAKIAGVLVFLAQLVIGYVAIRMDYELRWYIVTDRSLRIRWGLWTVQETTMSFANLQQVMLSQGPLQRLLGISDVRVESAGGGKTGEGEHAPAQSMHAGIFHGVENAAEIRDLIVERLKHFRETGLGDPDEHTAAKPYAAGDPPHSASELLSATRELLQALKAARG